MAVEINPKDTTRGMAFKLWMKAPNPMVTFFKTLDVTNLVKISKKILTIRLLYGVNIVKSYIRLIFLFRFSFTTRRSMALMQVNFWKICRKRLKD